MTTLPNRVSPVPSPRPAPTSSTPAPGPDGRLPEPLMQPTHPSLARPTPRIPTILVALAIVPTTGCFDPRVVADTEDGTEDGATTDATDGATTDAMTTVEPDSGSGEPPAVCGNGVVEGSEVCDDGVNDGSYGGCTADCGAPGPFCGDGVVNGEEPCDDGDDVDGNGCNVDCVVSGSVLWTVTYDGPDHGIDVPDGLTTDSAGNVIVSATLNLGNENTGWLRKYSYDGVPAWTLDITAPTGPVFNGPVVALLDDNIVFGGSYGPSDPSRDAWMWRISTAGETVWTETYASAEGLDRVIDIAIDEDDYIYALIEETQLPDAPYFRTFVRKYTPGGDEVWTQFHEPDTRGRFLATDKQGYFLVAGTQTNDGTSEIWLERNTSDGTETWTKTVDGGGATYPADLSVNAQGDIVVLASPFDAAPRAIRLGADGTEAGVVFPQSDALLLVLLSAHLEDDGDLTIGGSQVVSDEDAYGWLAKYDAEGTELWMQTHDGAFDTPIYFDSVRMITTDATGNVIAAGLIHDAANLLSNIWISKYAP